MRLEHILSFIVSVIVFGFVLYSSRSTAKGKSRATHKQKPASLRLEPQAQLHRRLWKAIKWAITTGVAVFAFLAVVDQFWGRPWPTDPEIHPHDTLNGSSLRLPFTIKNKSLFDYSNVEMTCGIDWAYFKDARLTKGTLNAIAFVNQTLLLPAEQQINYQCDASQLIRINRDGSWSIRSLEAMYGPVSMEPPLDFKKMCIWVRGDYKIAGLIPWSFTVGIFEWPAAPGALQWLEGSTYREGAMTQDQWIPNRGSLPPDVVTCSPKVHVPGVTFNSDGTATMGGQRLKTPTSH